MKQANDNAPVPPADATGELAENGASLQDALRRLAEARADIERLKRLIGMQTCPLKPGDLVSISDNGRSYQGTIEMVGGVFPMDDILQPSLNTRVLWTVRGHRLRKTDLRPSKWSFGFSEDGAVQRAGTWVLADRRMEAALRLMDRDHPFGAHARLSRLHGEPESLEGPDEI